MGVVQSHLNTLGGAFCLVCFGVSSLALFFRGLVKVLAASGAVLTLGPRLFSWLGLAVNGIFDQLLDTWGVLLVLALTSFRHSGVIANFGLLLRSRVP